MSNQVKRWSYEERNAKILRLRGKKSYGLIAEEFGISRNTVAGVMWRAMHPYETRICSPGHRVPSKIGTGYRSGKCAPKHLLGRRPRAEGDIA